MSQHFGGIPFAFANACQVTATILAPITVVKRNSKMSFRSVTEVLLVLAVLLWGYVGWVLSEDGMLPRKAVTWLLRLWNGSKTYIDEWANNYPQE
jgi:hypothetical protein